MKYMILAILCALIASCASLPLITGSGKVSPNERVSVPVWKCDDYAERLLETKGYKKPTANLDDESALWLWIAGICALGGIGCFVAGYMTSMNKLCIVGAMLCGAALVATGISAVVGLIAWIVGAGLIAVLCYLGWKLRNHKIQAFR